MKLLKRLNKYIIKTPNCWLWIGYKSKLGYSRVEVNGKTVFGHRVIYEIYKGRIHPNKEIDHLCSVRNCVNPKHLEVVTRKENNRRTFIRNGPAKFCKRGHAFNAENTGIQANMRRVCIACKRKYQHERYLKIKKEKYKWATAISR